MRLPRASAGTVQRLTKPNIAQEAAQAAASSQIANTLLGGVGTFARIYDQNVATTEANNALRQANTLQAFLSSPNINLNDPLVSDETRRQVLANNQKFDMTRVTVDGDRYQVPAEWVGPRMMSEYAKSLQSNLDNLSGNQRVIFNDLVKNSLAKTFNKIKLQVAKAEIESSSRNYEELQDEKIDQGLYDEALDIGSRAFGLNLWDSNKLMKRQKEVYQMGQERLNFTLDTLNKEAQAALRDGDRGTADAIRQQYVQELNEGETYGLVSRDEYNEKIQELDRSIEFESTRNDAVRIYTEKGLAAAQNYLRGRRNELPEYYEGHQWTVDINKIRSEIIGYQEDANRVQVLMRDRMEYDKAVSDINAALNGSHLLPDTPENRKKANLVYKNSRDSWYQLGMQGFLDQATNFVLKTGIFPSDMEAEMNAAMMSQNWRAAQNVMQLYNRVKSSNAALLGQLDERPAAFYSMLSTGARLFGEQDFEQIYNSAYEAVFANPDVVNQRRGEYTGGFKRKSMRTRMRKVESAFKEKYGGNIDITPEFEGDYRNLERTAYLLTGDLKVAQEMTMERMLATYAPQRVNGRDLLIRNAPDPQTMTWAQPQFQDYIKSRWPELVEQHGAESIQLVSRVAANQRLGEPAYGLQFINPSNLWDRQMLIDPQTGNEALWRPDFTQTDDYRLQQELAARMANSAEYVQEKYNEALEFFKQQEAQKNMHHYDFGLGSQIDQINMDKARQLFLETERIKGDDIIYEKSKAALKKAQEDAQEKTQRQEDSIRSQIEQAVQPAETETEKRMTSQIPAKDIL